MDQFHSQLLSSQLYNYIWHDSVMLVTWNKSCSGRGQWYLCLASHLFMSTLTILLLYFHRIAMLIRSSRDQSSYDGAWLCVHTGLPNNRMWCWYDL